MFPFLLHLKDGPLASVPDCMLTTQLFFLTSEGFVVVLAFVSYFKIPLMWVTLCRTGRRSGASLDTDVYPTAISVSLPENSSDSSIITPGIELKTEIGASVT